MIKEYKAWLFILSCYRPRRRSVRFGALLPLLLVPLPLPLVLVLLPLLLLLALVPSLFSLRKRPGVEMTCRLAEVSRPRAARAPFSAAFFALG